MRAVRSRPTALAVALVGTTLAATACAASHAASGARGHLTLRLGYFANVTHAAALVGIDKGFFQRDLGSTALAPQVFNAGGDEVTALLGGSIDAAFIGPGPAITAYVQSNGSAVRVVSGAAVGGAALVVRPGITNAAQLTGQRIATPQLGNTQDVALRTWLNTHGHHVTLNGGDVTIEPTDNATTLALFRTGKLDGAWVPEPWVSRLVLEAGGHVLVDEASLWPDGRFATTELVVSTRFLSAHPDAVQGLVRGELDAIGYLTTQPAGARAAVNDQLRALTGKPLSDAVLTRALAHVTITDDPAAATLQPVADHAHSAGTLTRRPDLHGLLDLRILNRILASRGQPAMSDAGLGGR